MDSMPNTQQRVAAEKLNAWREHRASELPRVPIERRSPNAESRSLLHNSRSADSQARLRYRSHDTGSAALRAQLLILRGYFSNPACLLALGASEAGRFSFVCELLPTIAASPTRQQGQRRVPKRQWSLPDERRKEPLDGNSRYVARKTTGEGAAG